MSNRENASEQVEECVTQPGEIQEIEHTTQLTMCCEVEPDVGYGTTECPECKRFDPRTIKRVTIERRVVRE